VCLSRRRAGMAEDEGDSLFMLTKRVREAVTLINALDENHLAVVVKRLARSTGERGPPFSDDELEQLQARLQIPAADLTTVIEACSFFLEV
jgi:hypothetical protein